MLEKPRILWIAATAAAVAAAIRVFDILLLKRYLDAPLVPALWIGAIFVFLLLARRTAHAVAPSERTRLQWTLIALDRPALGLLAFCLVLLYAQHWGYQRAASDGREYFVQVRSLVMDRDLDFANEEAFGVRRLAETNELAATIYPFGAALLWVPFYLAADLWLALLNLLGGELPRDGFFNPYQRAVGIGTWAYGCVGLALLFRLTSNYYRRPLAATTTIAVCCGSFLFWYFVVDPSLPHAVSMFSVALFVWLWHRNRDDRSPADWARLGLAAGTFVVAFSPQLWFWSATRGGWLQMPSTAHSVSWTGPLRDVLFTPDHGLFTWSPLLALAMLGFVGFVRRDRWFGALLLLAFVAQVYVLGSVDSPGYGFGARRMASCAVLFVLGLAALLRWLHRRPVAAPAAAVGLLLVGNLLFMLDVHQGRLAATGPLHSTEIFTALIARIGNPLAAPMNAWFAWRHGTDLAHYERLGTQTFNNLFIDVGGAADRRFLAGGWGNRELNGSDSFRWNSGAASIVLVPGINVYEQSIAAPGVRPGINEMRFEYAYLGIPSDYGPTDDDRRLGVRFVSIDLVRR